MRKPFFRKQTQSWCVWHGGKQVNLGKDKEAAFKEFYRLKAEKPDEKSTDWARLSIDDAVNLFLDWVKENRDPRTYEFHRSPLRKFVKFVGVRLKVMDLKPYHVENWIEERFRKNRRTGKPISDNTRHNAVRVVKRCFNWAKKRGHLQISPVANVEGYPTSRRDTYINNEQWEKLIAAIKLPDLLDMVRLMRLTGCRPQEAREVQARHYKPVERMLEFPSLESKGRREKRVILLPNEAVEIIERQQKARPAGCLFRNRNGKHWTKDALSRRFLNLSNKLGFQVTPYTIRHTWATDALARGVPIQFVAQIMGHKGTRVLMEVYNHLEKKKDTLRSALDEANGHGDQQPPQAA